MNFQSTILVRMKRQALILLWLGIIIFLGAASIVYYRIYITPHFWLKSEVTCDPFSEACFVRQCTEDCEENQEPDYYKIEHVQARFVSMCNPHREECPEILCSETESCEEELCTDINVPETESCNDPEMYAASHQSEEESEPLEEDILTNE